MKKRSLLVCCLLTGTFNNAITLKTVTDYAEKMPEYPPATKVWGNTDFTLFHNKHLPNTLISWLDSWGYRFHDFFTIGYFKELLEKTIEAKKANRQINTIASRLQCNENSSIILISSLRGHFHRLVRTLTWLNKEGLIDEKLKLRKDIYLLFNAYSINGSAYALETLTLIMALLDLNPDNCFMTRSRQELNNHWNDFALNREIKTRAQSFDVVELRKELNTFFSSLPKAIYIAISSQPQDFMKISSNFDEGDIMDEAHIHELFNTDNKEPLVFFNQEQANESTKPITLRVDINSDNLYLEPAGIFGLSFVEHNLETSYWNILPAIFPNDSPDVTSAIDSYTLITLKKSLRTSLISFWQRNENSMDFATKATFNLMTGTTTVGTRNETPLTNPINIGSTMSLISGVPHIGNEIKQGMMNRINAENNSGGIQGRLVKSNIYNDDYSPNMALQNIQKLIKESIDLILFPVGSPTLSLYFDYVKNNTISVFFPITGASIFRTSTAPGIMHLRPTYDEEIYFLLEYLTTTIGAKKFAFFYQNDSYGIGAAEAAHAELKKREGTSWIDLAYTRGTVNFEQQVKEIRSYQPDAIGFFSTAQAGRLLILQMGIEQCVNKYFFAISFIAEKPFQYFIEANGLRFICGSPVPNPLNSELPIAREYRKAMDNIKKSYDRFSFESYIGMSLFFDVAQKLNVPFTRESIMSALESLRHYSLKGLFFTFNPKTRSLAESLWLVTDESSDWIEKRLDSIPAAPTANDTIPEVQPLIEKIPAQAGTSS